MAKKSKTSPWVFLAALGAAAGVVAIAVHASAKPEPQTKPGILPGNKWTMTFQSTPDASTLSPDAIDALKQSFTESLGSNGVVNSFSVNGNYIVASVTFTNPSSSLTMLPVGSVTQFPGISVSLIQTQQTN